MTVLGIDTATAAATVGICRDGRILGERSELHERDHAASLPAMVSGVLRDVGLAVDDLEGVAVSIGPGSFTGLRVGLSFAKGLAYAGGIPIVGVPTLEAFALVVDVEAGLVAPCLDARKGEVYLAVYARAADGVRELVAARAMSPPAAAREIAERFGDRAGVVVGDAAERYPSEFASIAARGVALHPLPKVHPSGGVVAACGEDLLRRSDTAPPGGLEPLYLRPSEAERRRQGLH
ncbi:MAG: tRNA (adenosine(37)-N6)-threonylcarbamoyltransferase complex dimerization subunit type 1 TsaB [Candidatus Binatia bacterium]